MFLRASLVTLAVLWSTHPLVAQQSPAAGAAQPSAASMEKLAAHFVEGPGYVTFFHKQTPGYGGTYPECVRHCLADARCKMIEFYKPLRKCHLYNHTRYTGAAHDADVALKRNE